MQGTAKAGEDAVRDFDTLSVLCRKELQRLIKISKLYDEPFVYLRRLQYELGVYQKSGYSSVILIISDYIRWARNAGVVVGPGRGSAAGSLVIYLSGITSIDPIRFGLIFERFMNPERISLPDIDTDFSNRDAVIEYLMGKYGDNRITKVCVPSFFKPRSAIDEVSRLLKVDFAESKRITKLVGDAETFDEAFQNEKLLHDYEGRFPELFAHSRAIQGFVRQITTHPSAVILTKGPIGCEIPLQKAPGEVIKQGQLATSWDGEELDSLGYVKLDILTIDSLAVISKTIESVGSDVDFYDMPLDDAGALAAFERGETVGVFQFEEAKSVSILRQLIDIKFEDVFAVNALIRPGLDVENFISSRNSGNSTYLLPELEPILGPTYGVILYQEQVMRICVDIAGFSMGKADKVRKIIAKTANQKSERGLIEVYDDFKNGYLANGHSDEKFEQLWSMVLACQSYVFNLAHSVCYGYIAYVDMYLKTHYPLHFMCAALQTRSRELYIKECGRLGIKILPPDVNKSEENYSIDRDSIRVGLSCIKHIGTGSGKIVQRRPYTDEFDFVARAKPTAKQLESLCYSGAFDCFGDRSVIVGVFCKQGMTEKPTIGELATGEKEALGFYLLCNPLSEFDEVLSKCITAESTNLPSRAYVGGMVSRLKEHLAKSGPMAFLTLLTIDGEVEAIVWPSDFAVEKRKLVAGNVIIGEGRRTDRGNYAIKNISLLHSGVKS